MVVKKTNRNWNRYPVLPLAPDLTIETEASLLGWGAAAGLISTGGLWSKQERTQHINAVFVTVRTYFSLRGGQEHYDLKVDQFKWVPAEGYSK